MPYVKTTWKDRIVQFANRYLKSGETAGGVTLAPDPGAVTEAGTPLSAANLNKIEQGIFDAAAKADSAQAKADNSVQKTGDVMSGGLTVGGGANALALKAGPTQDHVYTALYPRSSDPNLRGSYAGFAGGGSNDYYIRNELPNGDMYIETPRNINLNSGAVILADGKPLKASYITKRAGTFYISNNADSAVLFTLDDVGNLTITRDINVGNALVNKGWEVPGLRNSGGKLEMLDGSTWKTVGSTLGMDAETGWVQLDNRQMLMWGRTPSIGAGASTVVNFPFYLIPRAVVLTAQDVGSGYGMFTCGPPGNTAFNVYNRGTAAAVCHWHAYGWA